MRAWYIAIFVAVFGLYLLSSSREPAWGDSRPMWEVADRLVQHGAIDIKTRWPDDMPPGRHGKTYGIAAIGTVLVHLPGAALTAVTHSVTARHDILLRPIFTHLAPAVLGALACAMFFGLLRDLGRSARTASACTAILACASTVWVYARMPYGEIIQVACFIGLFRYTLRVIVDSGRRDESGARQLGPARRSETGTLHFGAAGPSESGAFSAGPTRANSLWLGFWAGYLLNTKYVYATAICGAVLLIAWALRKRLADLARVLLWASVTAGPLLGLALFYNYLRFGSITQTGYEPYLSWYFGGSLFDGAWGMLASPNKSALLYSPPLVVALLGWPRAIREHKQLGITLAALVVPTFIVYCSYRSWSGDYAWGPRYFVWAIPVLLVGMAWFIDPGGQAKPGPLRSRGIGRYRRAFVAAVVAAGIVVQLLGNALYWDHFIRIAIEAKNQWLGNPNRTGAYIPEKSRGHCDSCFEDTYEILWTPAFQPIRGHWWLIESLARGDADGAQAQVDAPWRRYTTLSMTLPSYPRARIDWWGLLWLEDATPTWLVGSILLVLFTAATAFGIWRWIRLHRSGIPGPDAEGSAEPT